MAKVVIGAPVYARAWILRDWLSAIERQNWNLNDLGFVFQLAPNDQETHDILFEWQAKHPELFCFDAKINTIEQHEAHTETRRTWTYTKYEKMARLRNNLLDTVSCISPDRYFSLDSDILLEDKNTILELVRLTERYDAVSTLAYMTPKDTNFPSVMSWTTGIGGDAHRVQEKYRIGHLFKSDIIMASKMMSKPVFENVRYRFHRKGEDLGWSQAATEKGFSLYCASNIYTPHLMYEWMLNEYKEKGFDPRAPKIAKTI